MSKPTRAAAAVGPERASRGRCHVGASFPAARDPMLPRLMSGEIEV
jgi:hypothetical protein